jgi:uncharacterized membrane protein HdeD (DUF308 family)
MQLREVQLDQIVRIILAKNWWSLVIRGCAAIALGATAVLWRDLSLGDLRQVFFYLALLDGIVGLAGATRAAQESERWVPLLLEAIVGIAAAILVVSWPGAFTEITLIYFIAAWGLLTGVLEIASGVLLRRRIRGEWLMALSGFASLALCLLMAALPLADPPGIAFWLGVYAFGFGALLIALGFRLRSWARLEMA